MVGEMFDMGLRRAQPRNPTPPPELDAVAAAIKRLDQYTADLQTVTAAAERELAAREKEPREGA